MSDLKRNKTSEESLFLLINKCNDDLQFKWKLFEILSEKEFKRKLYLARLIHQLKSKSEDQLAMAVKRLFDEEISECLLESLGESRITINKK